MQFLDIYLEKWDKFAQGQNKLVQYLKINKNKFESLLSQSLDQNDLKAPSRLVFYTFVQVGGFIDCDSQLGKSCEKLFGQNVSILIKDSKKFYFAGEIYKWWELNNDKYKKFELLENWYNRDFSKSIVIPMYKSAK